MSHFPLETCYANDLLKDWDPIINEVLSTFPDMDAYPLEAAPWMKDLVKDDAVAFVGDAAHRKKFDFPFNSFRAVANNIPWS
jgi:hypothetical protein